MRIRIRALVGVLLITVVAAAGAVRAAQMPDGNVKTIAGILAKLNHFATDAEKKTLQGIVSSPTASVNDKMLAQALMNVQHTATAGDKPKLEALSKDMTASESVRTIAGILATLNHTPTDAQKATLAKLAAG